MEIQIITELMLIQYVTTRIFVTHLSCCDMLVIEPT